MKIFLSYARPDDSGAARQLRENLTVAGNDVFLDADSVPAGSSWDSDTERAIAQADVVYALFTPAYAGSDNCRRELLLAVNAGKQVVPIGGNFDLPIGTRILSAGPAQPSSPGAARENPIFNAPPLPGNYIERPDAIGGLRRTLLERRGSGSMPLTAVEGVEGIGKTVLVRAVCDDPAVRAAFPGGILWATVGKEPPGDLVPWLSGAAKTLGADLHPCASEPECMTRYRLAQRGKVVLVVADDARRAIDLVPFQPEPPHITYTLGGPETPVGLDGLLADLPMSHLLFTTCNPEVAARTGARRYVAPPFTEEQSCKALLRWSGETEESLRQLGVYPACRALIRESGGLPLALAMIGVMLRGKPPAAWDHVLGRIEGADHAIQVCVDDLDARTRERYLALAVLLQNMPVHPAIQQALWNADEGGARETAERLAGLSLAQRDRESGCIRLHDLQLDYVRAQYPDREALELIHGAVRLSRGVIERDPMQFVSQVSGRLMPYEALPGVRRFTESLARGGRVPWLRLRRPALHSPGAAVRTLHGHSAGVQCVAVLPDGQRAVSACWDDTLKVWDLETGRALRTLEGHSSLVNSVAVSPDGRLAVSASEDKTLKVWDVETGSELRTLVGHTDSVHAVAITPDGRRAVSGSWDQKLKVWDLETGCELRTIGGAGAVHGVAVTPEGRRAVSASADSTLRVWDLETGCRMHTLAGHTGFVAGVAVTPDGRRVVSASGDNTLKVWDAETGRELRTLAGHSSPVNSVAVTPDGRRAVSASWDYTLKVWDLETGREERTLAGHSFLVYGVAVTPDGRRAVSASDDNTLKVWDLEAGRDVHVLKAHLAAVMAVAVSPDGRRAVTASWDTTIKVWDLETGRELHTLSCGYQVWGVAVSPDGARAVSASSDLERRFYPDSELKVWDLETGRELRTLGEDRDGVYALAIGPDGRMAVCSHGDSTLRVWDLEAGCELRTLQGHSGRVFSVAISADGRRAVSASADHTLKVWDLETGCELRSLEGHSSAVLSVAVTPDGLRAISASEDKTVKVWDLETGGELRTLEGCSTPYHWLGRRGVAVSPDGRLATSVLSGNMLRVWNLEEGTPVATFTCEAAPGCCVFAGPRRIVAGDAEGQVYFLSLERPRED